MLTVSFCLLEALTENLEHQTSLVSLDASYNKIEKVDPALGQLTANLRTVDLSGNSIYYFPAEMLKLNLASFRYQDNFTSPVFWKNCINSSAKKLSDICYLAISNLKDEREKKLVLENLPDEDLEKFMHSHYDCSTCGRQSYGEKIKILRPCKSLWGRNLGHSGQIGRIFFFGKK